jgi:hypothetical protein
MSYFSCHDSNPNAHRVNANTQKATRIAITQNASKAQYMPVGLSDGDFMPSYHERLPLLLPLLDRRCAP